MKNFLFRLSSDAFARRYSNYGYITNQRTKHDRVYNNIGSVFLEHISREPKEFLKTAESIHNLFVDVPYETVQGDFLEFIKDLEKNKYIVTGKTAQEIEGKDFKFSYKSENPKTFTFNFKNQKENLQDTAEFFYEKFHQNPTIFGMQIELTNCCNERCVHCYIPHHWKEETLEKEVVLNVLDQTAEMGTLGLTLSGGEPMLHPDFIEILQHARKKDFSVTILSNLTLLNEKILNAIKEANINGIQVSLYSMNPLEHDFITKLPGSFEKTLKSIQLLFENDIPVQISCPVMKINRHSYKNVMKWAYDHKMKAYTDFIMMAQSNFDTHNLDNRISIAETEELLRDIISVDQEYRTLLKIEPKPIDVEKYKKKPVCGVAVDNICLAANGNYYPCSGWQGMMVGNAKNQKLKEVWENSEQLKFLRTVTNSSFPECISCEAKDYCAMCMVRNYNESGGDMFKINDHFCKAAFLNKRIVEEYKKKAAL
ncbi:MAG: radical SAM protein [bacterium]